jgi:hypothetical protein
LDGLAISMDNDGRPIRSAQAIEVFEDFGLWTTWTAFAPSILRIRHFCASRRGSVLGMFLLCTLLLTSFSSLIKEEPSKASKPSIEQ